MHSPPAVMARRRLSLSTTVQLPFGDSSNLVERDDVPAHTLPEPFLGGRTKHGTRLSAPTCSMGCRASACELLAALFRKNRSSSSADIRRSKHLLETGEVSQNAWSETGHAVSTATPALFRKPTQPASRTSWQHPAAGRSNPLPIGAIEVKSEPSGIRIPDVRFE